MSRTRHRFSDAFKAKVALEAIKGVSTVADLATRHKVHANQITQWKKQAENALPTVFGSRKGDDTRRQEELTDRNYQQIGQLKVELDWLKQNLSWTVERKRMAIDLRHPSISIASAGPSPQHGLTTGITARIRRTSN